MKIIKGLIPYLITIIVVLLIREYVGIPVKVTGVSMQDTLYQGDLLLLDKVSYKFSNIKRFDVVVVKEEDELLIKRVIGLPGESVSYIDNELYINDELVEENYSIGETGDFLSELKNDEYFVMGDNREESADSRNFGSYSKDDILGKTSLLIYPFDKIKNQY